MPSTSLLQSIAVQKVPLLHHSVSVGLSSKHRAEVPPKVWASAMFLPGQSPRGNAGQDENARQGLLQGQLVLDARQDNMAHLLSNCDLTSFFPILVNICKHAQGAQQFKSAICKAVLTCFPSSSARLLRVATRPKGMAKEPVSGMIEMVKQISAKVAMWPTTKPARKLTTAPIKMHGA